MKKIRITTAAMQESTLRSVPKPLGKEAGDGDGADLGRVPAQALGHDEPVEVGADGQTDGGPAHLGHAAQVGQAGQTHEQVAAHVARPRRSWR